MSENIDIKKLLATQNDLRNRRLSKDEFRLAQYALSLEQALEAEKAHADELAEALGDFRLDMMAGLPFVGDKAFKSAKALRTHAERRGK